MLCYGCTGEVKTFYCAPAQLARDRCGMGIRQLALQAIKAGKSKKKQAKALITLEPSIVLKTFFLVMEL